MKSKGRKADFSIKDVHKRDVSEKELKSNAEESKKKKIILFYIPIGITIIFAIAYIFTLKLAFIIILSLAFFVSLFGIDGNGKTCPECHKWGKVIWQQKSEKKIRTKTTKITKGNGKVITKEEKEEIDRRKGKCLNCGREITKEKIKKIS